MVNRFRGWFGVIGFGLFVLLGLGLFRWTPPGLLRVLLPLLDEADWPVTAVSETARISPGRTTWLFFVGSRLGDGAAVQQYLHWYPDEETAVVNYNQNKNGSPQTFPGDPSQYMIQLLPSANIAHTLLCIEPDTEQIRCEYRAQAGHWTMHIDFNSHDKDTLSISQIKELTNLISQKLNNTVS